MPPPAISKRHRGGRPYRSPMELKTAFGLGLAIGAFLMFWYLGATYSYQWDQKGGESTNNKLVRSASSSSALGQNENGWHPIHIFYGDKAGLKAPDQPWYAQVHQDEIVMDLIGPNGFFIDLAANDAVEFSNTLALERLGWNGLCIEPNPGYWYGLSHRECTVVGALLGATKEKVQVKFRGVFGGIVGRLNNKMADRKAEPEAPEEDRYTTSALEVFERFNVPKVIDYLSLDIEGAEYLVMKDFPFDQYQFKILTVERPRKPLRELLESKGYVFLKYLAWWGETLWAHKSTGFTPEHPKIQKIITEEKN